MPETRLRRTRQSTPELADRQRRITDAILFGRPGDHDDRPMFGRSPICDLRARLLPIEAGERCRRCGSKNIWQGVGRSTGLVDGVPMIVTQPNIWRCFDCNEVCC